jgi:glycosyltransferase involved in cell wall biosynthesis
VTIEISVILTTCNRAHLLPQVLEGLARQTLGPDRFEVVVVDDGSTDATEAAVQASRNTLQLRYFRMEAGGVAAARNLGVLLAQGPLVLLLDDDDVAGPELLAAHLAMHLRWPEPGMAVLGLTTLGQQALLSPVMRHVTEVGRELFCYESLKPGQILDYTSFWGGRVSCKRGLLVRHGLFHPGFRFGCEDIELGWRLSKSGLRVVYEPRAHSEMIRSLTFDQFCRRSYQQGRSQHLFASLHAEPAIQSYCGIDEGRRAWAAERSEYASHLRWTRQLEHLTLTRRAAGLPVHDELQRTLTDAYGRSFFLSRAKGIADAASTAAPVLPTPHRTGSVFDYGLGS